MDARMADDPFALFDTWFAEARLSEINDSNAMALATVDATGQPSVRMVLLKGHDARGFVFYTNRESRKAQDLGEGSKAALTAFDYMIRLPQAEAQAIAA
jgi:pyridoxamine 5'-phosphate oxidase